MIRFGRRRASCAPETAARGSRVGDGPAGALPREAVPPGLSRITGSRPMKRAREILRKKGHDVWSIDLKACVLDAIKLMAEKEIGAVIVTDGDRLAGILSERDYTRKVILKGRTSQQTRAGEIMTTDVVTVSPSHTVNDCMGLMTDRHIRHLPVLEDRRLVGMLSIGDLVKAIIADQQFTIEQLESYISS